MNSRDAISINDLYPHGDDDVDEFLLEGEDESGEDVGDEDDPDDPDDDEDDDVDEDDEL